MRLPAPSSPIILLEEGCAGGSQDTWRHVFRAITAMIVASLTPKAMAALE